MSEKPSYRELEQRCKALEQKFAEHQQAEEVLLELEKRYRDLFDNINDLIMIHDLKGNLLNVNPAVSKLSGYTFEELIGRPISDFIFPEFRSLFQDEYLKEIKKQGHSEGVVIFQDKDGKKHYVEYNNVLVTPQGRKPYISGLGRDITDRVHAERALQKSYDELDLRVKERTADLARANDQLKLQIEERKIVETEKEKLIVELKKALREVKTLGGLLPICASCKKIRDDQGYWNQLEHYIQMHSEAEFSHSVCPDCAKMLYPELGIQD
jgi:PAS domain S-box-containing protein